MLMCKIQARNRPSPTTLKIVVFQKNLAPKRVTVTCNSVLDADHRADKGSLFSGGKGVPMSGLSPINVRFWPNTDAGKEVLDAGYLLGS